MSILTVKVGTTVQELQQIGTAADLGATILEGKAEIYGLPIFGNPTDAIHAGYFGVSKSRFKMVYPFNEQATVVDGEVKLTDDATGISQVYRKGDSWIVEKGTSVLWEVVSESFVKAYLAAI